MTNFLLSIEQGIDSAISRESNFLEIHNLFQELKEQILEFSKGKVTLELILSSAKEDSPDIDYLTTKEGLYRNKHIVFTLTKQSNKFEHITPINLSKNGYPAKLEIDGNQFEAFDKISLEELLKKLLSSPSTGQRLYKLIKSAEDIKAP